MIRNLLATMTVLFGLFFVECVYAKDYGPVRSNETLWHIASHNRPSYDLSTQQTMLAIREANPSAFKSTNINSLKTGSTIRLPSFAEIDQVSRSYALREVRRDNKAWKGKKAATSSSYKRHYRASQRELKKLQKRLKREKRKVRKLKEELAELSDASGDGSATKQTKGIAASTVKLQEEVTRLEQIIEEKNVHIAQLNNIKTVANETIKRQQVENQALFNKLKSIAPDEVLNHSATTGSLQLTGIDEAAAATQVASAAGNTEAQKASTASQSSTTKRNNVFILALSLLCILFIVALIWRVYSQKSARKSAMGSDNQTTDTVIDEKESVPDATSRKEPLLST